MKALTLMEAIVTGDYFSFRTFLIGLGGIASIEQVEEIQIRQGPNNLELKLTFWIARSMQ